MNWLINLFLALIIIVALLGIFFIQGCSNTLENVREHEFTQGCLVVEAEAKIGYLNQTGKIETCKLKCSGELPEQLSYKYKNQKTGCDIEVIKNERQGTSTIQ